MSYKKQLTLLAILSVTILVAIAVCGFITGYVGCGNKIVCMRRLLTSYTYSQIFVPVVVFLLALTPLFFTKENVYIAWRKFAVFALPAMALLVLLTPNSVGAGWINFGIDKETVSMFLSVVFLFVSWGLIAFKARHI